MMSQENQNVSTSTSQSTGSVSQGHSYSYPSQQRQQQESQFACLYTKHKTQKRRVWQDGRLILQAARAKLFNAQPTPGSADPVLDECELTTSQHQALRQGHETQLETERYLIQIEGPWVPPSRINTGRTNTGSVSSSMQKVMQRKFQRPTRFVPPPPHVRPDKLQAVLGKRRRPLQPGELERMHYGTTAPRGSNIAAAPLGPAGTESYSASFQPPPPPPDRPSGNPNPYHRLASSDRRSPQAPPTGHTNPQRLPQQDPTNFTTPPSNPSFEAPDAFVLQAPSQAHPREPPTGSTVPRQRPGNLNFVQNEFNANGFYGFDEEEEEEEEQQPTWTAPPSNHQASASFSNEQSHSHLHSHSVTPLDSSNTHTSHDNPTLTTGGRQDQPSPFSIATDSSNGPQTTAWGARNDKTQEKQQNPSSVPNGSLSRSTGALPSRSTSELMALFGAAPIARPSSSSSNNSTNNEKENTNNEAETVPTAKNAMPVQVAPPLTETTAPSNDEGSDQVRFYLPSPPSSSASSSDEEEE